MTNILESEFVDQTRPYSQNELGDMRHNLYRHLRVGKERAAHEKCGHFYTVKENGKKEKEIKENSGNIGNCSVCWKLSKTHPALKRKAGDVIKAYVSEFYTDPKYFTYDLFDLENVFYRWLYQEV